MPIEVIMPQLGESIVEGTVMKWLKQEGEPIDEFEPLLEVNTDKVDTEIPSPASGYLLRVYVEEGETVQTGTVLAMLGEPGESVPEAIEVAGISPTNPSDVQSAEKAPAAEITQESVAKRGEDVIGFISPVVARIAAEHKVDLLQVKGTGSKGRITKKDVLALVNRETEIPWEKPASGELFRPTEEVFGGAAITEEDSSPQPEAGSVLPVDVVRNAIAEHMVRSRRTSPHVTTVVEVDISRVVAHRKVNKSKFDQDGVSLTYLAYILSATVAGLKAWPIVNSTWMEDGIHLHKQINIGVAVSMGERGLIVPVIKSADQISLLGIARSIQDLASRARNHGLKPYEVQGGTFTITNHGASGSIFATPIINQPQAAILGVGKIQKRVIVVEASAESSDIGDSIAIRPMVYLTLTFDHRILDGVIADSFLGEIVSHLEKWSLG
jgi:2-oxoglutarate dehydrogenase E2 component (dihydrolipoamide succinyltransferase)